MKLNYINENIQMIHISANTQVTQSVVTHAMVMAKMNFDYAKFYTNKWFITVAFMKDGNATISHNIKSLDFQRELNILQRNKFNLNLYSDFITRWLNRIRNSKYYDYL